MNKTELIQKMKEKTSSILVGLTCLDMNLLDKESLRELGNNVFDLQDYLIELVTMMAKEQGIDTNKLKEEVYGKKD